MELNAAMYCNATEIHVVVSSSEVSQAEGTQFNSQSGERLSLLQLL
jgi:hypothetical protein